MVLLTFLFAVLLLFAFPLGEFSRWNVDSQTALTLRDFFVVVISIIGISLILKRKQYRLLLHTPISIFILLCVFSLVFNVFTLTFQEFFVSSLYIFRWIFFAGLYPIVSLYKNKDHIVALLFGGGLITLGIGYIQYFYYPSLRNLYYLGWDEHLRRMFGTFFDPNFFGAFLVLFSIFVLGLLFERSENKVENKPRNMGYILVLGLVLMAIFLTYSRGAYGMLCISLGTFLLVKGYKKIFFVILPLLVVLFIVFALISNRSKEGTNLFRTVSTEARFGSAVTAFTIFIKNPLFGVGFDSYRYAQFRYGYLTPKNNPISHSAAGADNSWLFVLATTGIVGFAAYSYLWFYILKKAWRQKNNNIFAPILIASSIGLFANSFFINSLFYASIMLWMWILIGLAE